MSMDCGARRGQDRYVVLAHVVGLPGALCAQYSMRGAGGLRGCATFRGAIADRW